ncbi:MAG: AAA family ATPase [Anaerolineae bacterium]|nr:AAA family ATPase [Anaerolineae bacterium]
MLSIQLLGNFAITHQGEPVPGLTGSRAQALLAYLLLHRQAPQSREFLAYTFWPDSSEPQARTNLRRELHQLRRSLAHTGSFLRSVDAQSIQWNTAIPLSLDVADFEDALAQADRSDSVLARKEHLRRAVTLYQGDLLPALYDDWLLPRREELRQGYLRTLEQLIALLVSGRDYAAAVQSAQRLLRYDPLHEAGYRQLMALYALQNDRAHALHTYHTCATVLERELGAPPSPETQALYERLLTTAEAPNAAPATQAPATAPLIGRAVEWLALLAAWRKSSEGRAHCVLIEGEAGIGKTRLAEELLAWVSRQGIAAARTRSYAAEGSLAFAPVIEWLRSPAMRAGLTALDDVWRAEVARILPELRVEPSHPTASSSLNQGWQRQRLFEALGHACLADEKPKCLLIDDLQWCDQETLEWLRYLLRFAPRARLLLLGTARAEEARQEHPLHEFERALRSGEQMTTIDLSPLTADETTALATQISRHTFDPVAAARLFAESEGNPLFVVELVRARYHQPDADSEGQRAVAHHLPDSGAKLPAKVRTVIESRLAQLSPTAQRLAGLAATIGRSFTFEVLSAACKEDEDAVTNGLDELWRRRIIREQGVHGYDFSHDRIRDVAYAGVSPAQRRLFHRRVVEALEAVRGDELDAISGELAVHCERANLLVKAIQYHRRAAAVARRAFANEDAIERLSQALLLLRSLPETQERNRQELSLQIDLSGALQAARSMTAPEVEAAYRRAEELAQLVGEPPELFRARWGWWASQFSVSAQSVALEIGTELLALATKFQDPDLLLQAHHALWTSSFTAGDLPAALAHCEQGRAIYRPETHHAQLYVYGGHDAGVCGLSFAGPIQWLLGYPDRALNTDRLALDLSQQFTHPATVVQPSYWSAILHQLRRDAPAVRLQAEAAGQLSRRYAIPTWQGWDTCLVGWAEGVQGQEADGIEQIQRGLVESRNRRSRLLHAYFMTLLAEVYGRSGQLDWGLQTLDAALTEAEQTGERWWLAEMHRLAGDLRREQGSDSAAEQAYLRAIEIARCQQARSLELRATTALCRLWRRQGKHAQAHQSLSELVGWFTEGFDTYDLRVAKELLQQLTR